jgi:hypothetical protein
MTARIAMLCSLLTCGCAGGERLRSYCSQDGDCPLGTRCDRASGLCLCTSDAFCGPDEYCGPDGLCHRRLSCDTNLDCPEDTLCDTTTGNCIERDKCTQDVQCPFGQICSESLFRCAAGCRRNGDCVLGSVCREGSCQAGLCDDKSFCGYGQLCEDSSSTCRDDTRGPYCQPCTPGSISNPYRCGPGPNFCVMTGNDPSLPPFCGVDCDEGQECPNGYSCDLILVAPEGSCSKDEECSSGSCYKNEGDTVGFCLCNSDGECPSNVCDDSMPVPACSTTRKACAPGSSGSCRPLLCIDGLCLIGRNCTPLEGLRCQDLEGS